MTRTVFVLFSAVLLGTLSLVPVVAFAGDATYSYMAPDALKARVVSGAPMTVVDIQVKEEFDQHHIKGALATYAYPVKSEGEKTRLDAVIDQVASGSDPVVIVCPRGGGGAQRAYDYLAGKGVSSDRLFILEKGQAGWPYGEMLEGAK